MLYFDFGELKRRAQSDVISFFHKYQQISVSKSV